VDLEIELLARVREVLDEHAAECDQRPKAILLNPANHKLLGWDEFLGLPVLPDPRIEPMKASLVCGDRGWGGIFEGERVWWKPDGNAYRLVEPEAQA
jgi:hypothetical protein